MPATLGRLHPPLKQRPPLASSRSQPTPRTPLLPMARLPPPSHRPRPHRAPGRRRRPLRPGQPAVPMQDPPRPEDHARRDERKGATTMMCSVIDCAKPSRTKGLCPTHYMRLLRHGHTDPTRVRGTCSLPDCDQPHGSLGYCHAHAAKQRRHGDPTAVRMGKGELNPNWSADEVRYLGAHKRVYRARGRADQHTCVDCHQPANQWSYNHDDPAEHTEVIADTLVAFSKPQQTPPAMATAAANTAATPANIHAHQQTTAHTANPCPHAQGRGVHIADQHKRATRRGTLLVFCTKLLVGGVFQRRWGISAANKPSVQQISARPQQTTALRQQISRLRQQTSAACCG